MKILRNLYNISKLRWVRVARRTKAYANVCSANRVMMAISKELNLAKSRGSNSAPKDESTPKKESDCRPPIKQ